MTSIKNLSPDFSNIINEGGFGDIYRCKQNDDVLIKMIKKFDNDYNGEYNKNIIKKLYQHKNLMNIFGIDKNKYNDIYLIYIENINGIDLFEYTKNNTMNTNEITNCIKQILSGLKFLHKNKITHRDIKLDNIIINENKEIKIIDFGLSCIGYPCKGLVGTSGFFAPEMIYSINNYNSKCDIWSTGCILYFLVCNYFPFYFNYDRKSYITQLNNQINIYYYKDKWIDQKLYNLCKKMLIYDYNARYSSKECYKFLNT